MIFKEVIGKIIFKEVIGKIHHLVADQSNQTAL